MRPVIEANRRGKREQIIDAAKHVLAQDGLSACTARAVADASPLTKSAVHYYFADIHEIIDLAMRDHVSALVDQLRAAAATESTAPERLWSVAEAYLATFADRPSVAYLWFEYWIDTGRRGQSAAITGALDDMHALLRELAADIPVDDPDETAHTLLSWLMGTIVQQRLRPRPAEALRREMARILS
ncbi:TetR/AcrR family transcriptional regulator [Nocardia sp. NPDC004068]|uniref:TetR/AcrR family transcriptional regulator n=1 Tax=Nocardia sp. NPDC004068 TaxID=3364303 RepID=UPI00368B24D1